MRPPSGLRKEVTVGLLEEWRDWALKCEGPPYMLPTDKGVLKSPRMKEKIVLRNGWESVTGNNGPNKPGDAHLHLDLIPVPFMGDLEKASVYVLMLNPGLSPRHYFEYRDARFRQALVANLRQKPVKGEMPFVSMDPQFAWHDGFSYWHEKLGEVIERIANRRGITFAEARKKLAAKLAVIQLVPYRSAKKPSAGRLRSVKLVKDYVRDFVIKERCKEKGALVIMARGVSVWKTCLPRELREKFKERKYGDNGGRIIRYSSGQARGASLNPHTQLIVEHIERDC